MFILAGPRSTLFESTFRKTPLQTHDYIEFFTDSSRTTQLGQRYHGGRGGGDKNFPGTGSNPPLEILAESFVAVFHSDGSGVDWGFK